MLPTGVVERGSPYARSGIEDGIYEHNGTITGAPGLELLTQMTGSPTKSRNGSIYGYENSAMALIVLILLSAGFYWSWSQDPEMASLVIQSPGSVGRNSNKGHKYCALIVFFLMMLRGCILGGLQTYNSVQAADASTSGDDNELAKYPLSQASRSTRTLLDMIASRETKLFNHKRTTRISPELLSLFVRNVQGEDKLGHVCEVPGEFTGSSSTLIGSTQSDLEIQPATDISPDALAAHLLSDNNTAIRGTSTSHDLDRPINEYFISTSHNTYLLGRQVATRSKLEGYVEALSRGCRSVEVDCWNGQRGQPVVKHGYSLTKSINFRDVINTIKEHAFATSDLPLWLSLEVHCNQSQRDIMARVMIEVFGESLITEPIPGCFKTLPSPYQLRRKILLKVKMPQDVNPQDSDQEDHDAVNLNLEQNGDQAKSEWGVQVGPVIPQTEQEDPQEDLLQSLAIYGAGKRLPTPDTIDTHRNFIYSISETNLRKRINKEHSLGLTDTQHMVRVYPDPSRVNSSNFDPLECWKHGVQMAALNYQTDDFQMKLNDAMFAGSLGYILKAQPEPKQIRIAIDVLMAKDLQGLEGGSPLHVELELLLPDMPGQKVRTTAVSGSPHRTDIIFDQNLDISMGTKYPHLAFLYWSIRRSNSHPVYHSGIAKVNNLKKGYRLLPLGGLHGGHILCKISVNVL
ncbi:hypothetical protein NW768_008438 [Fusarium equiseti]|uniref:Phosphoinositide phospholipase C n=1 Tax=Fusarium equiseti TaxID=61235 RepID=A0ABQ8R703_FUSEQ|nr:hypothetical protein NW768_008438 [Fusarium equiseti]